MLCGGGDETFPNESVEGRVTKATERDTHIHTPVIRIVHVIASAELVPDVSASAVPDAFCQLVPHSQLAVACAALAGRRGHLGASAGPTIGMLVITSNKNSITTIRKKCKMALLLTRMCQRRRYLAFSPGTLKFSHISRNSWYLGVGNKHQENGVKIFGNKRLSGLPVDGITLL